MRETVYSLCDWTANMLKPWANAGYRCIAYDIQHRIRNGKIFDYSSGGSIELRWGDVRHMTPPMLKRPRMVFAFPPCTHLSVSGARDWKSKGLRLFIDALEIVEACRMLCEYSGAPWMIENPVSRLSSSWRKPDYTFSPFEYGDSYTKKTHLWVGKGFIMPKKKPVEITRPGYIHRMTKDDRANRRSATPMGFARAVFRANS